MSKDTYQKIVGRLVADAERREGNRGEPGETIWVKRCWQAPNSERIKYVAEWENGGNVKTLNNVLDIAQTFSSEIYYELMSSWFGSFKSSNFHKLFNFQRDPGIRIYLQIDSEKYQLKDLHQHEVKDTRMPFLALLAVLASVAAFYILREKKGVPTRSTMQPGQSPGLSRGGYLLVTWSRSTNVDFEALRKAGGKLSPELAELVKDCSSFKWVTEAEFGATQRNLREAPKSGEDKPEGTYLLGILLDSEGRFQSVRESFTYDAREQIEKLAQQTNRPDFDVKLIETVDLQNLNFKTRG